MPQEKRYRLNGEKVTAKEWRDAAHEALSASPACSIALEVTPVDNGYLITRKADGIAFIQRRYEESATESPLSFHEEMIVTLCDMLTRQ